MQQRQNGLKLLWLSKSNKSKEALALLSGEEPVGVKCKDEAGWYAIHYAAAEGNTDLVTLLVEKGVSVNVKDSNGETPLHKCSRRGHVICMVALVTQGANLNKFNKQGQTPLEVAVISKNVTAVRIFMLLGEEPTLQDWSWTMEELGKAENEILQLLIDQHSRIPGFKYGSIKQTLTNVKEQKTDLEEFGFSLIVNNEQFPFYLHCSRLTAEFSELTDRLTDNQEQLSDEYELHVFGCRGNKLNVTVILKVQDLAQLSERICVMNLEGNNFKLQKIEKFEDKAENEESGYTLVELTGLLEENKTTRFGIYKQAIPEVFAISTEQVTLNVQTDPGTSIDIPKDTFETPSEMEVNILPTKEANEDEVQGDPILLTNVLEVTVTNGQQPKEPIRVTIPVHTVDNDSSNDVVVFASIADDPEEEDDWEVKEAKLSDDRRTALFYVDHFSHFSACNRKTILRKAQVVDALSRSINKKRKAIFFLATKWGKGLSSEIVIECTGFRNVDSRIASWIAAGYDETTVQKSEIYTLPTKQNFKIKLGGNLIDSSGEEYQELTFLGNRNNNRVFNIGILDSNKELMGTAEILQEVEEEILVNEPPVVKQKSFWCTAVEPMPKTKSKTAVAFEPMFVMDIKLVEPEIAEEEDENKEMYESCEDSEPEIEEEKGTEFEEEPQDNEDEEEEKSQELKPLKKLTHTIYKGGRPINVLAIKTKKKGYIR